MKGCHPETIAVRLHLKHPVKERYINFPFMIHYAGNICLVFLIIKKSFECTIAGIEIYQAIVESNDPIHSLFKRDNLLDGNIIKP
jgi:hypothetical protein